MTGLLAELAGTTLTGTLLISLIGLWRAKKSDSFSGAGSKAFSGSIIGWLVVSVIGVWGAAPQLDRMVIAPVMLLPSFAIAFLLIRHLMLRAEKQSEDLETFK